MACDAGLYSLRPLETNNSSLQEILNMLKGAFRFLRRQSQRRTVGRGVKVHAINAMVSSVTEGIQFREFCAHFRRNRQDLTDFGLESTFLGNSAKSTSAIWLVYRTSSDLRLR